MKTVKAFIEELASSKRLSKKNREIYKKKLEQTEAFLSELNQSTSLHSYVKHFRKESLSRVGSDVARKSWIGRRIQFRLEQIKTESWPFSEERAIEILSSMLRGDYSKTLSLKHTRDGVWAGLYALLVFYSQMAGESKFGIPEYVEGKLDIARAELIHAAAKVTGKSVIEAESEIDDSKRLASSSKVVGKFKETRQQHVLRIYFEQDQEIKTGMKRHAVAKVIEKVFEAQQERGLITEEVKRPSTQTITDYLWKDPKIRTHFRQEGRYWIIKR